MFVAYGLCLAAVALAATSQYLGGPSPWGAYLGYAQAPPAIALMCVLVYLFCSVGRSAMASADRPLGIALAGLKPRLPVLLWYAFAFPVFMACFTAAKSGIGPIVGFGMDPALAKIDHAILGRDAWRIAHSGGDFGHFLGFAYYQLWSTLLALSIPLTVMLAPEKGTRFVVTFAASFLIGGIVLAYLMPSSGPLFAGDQFAPLREAVRGTQFQFVESYLKETMGSPHSVPGGGISAMPSMHIATVAIFVLASRRTILFWPALGFAAVIFWGSVYSGFHYAVDAPVAVLVAWACWRLSAIRGQFREQATEFLSSFRRRQA